jgi:hypothetical protein
VPALEECARKPVSGADAGRPFPRWLVVVVVEICRGCEGEVLEALDALQVRCQNGLRRGDQVQGAGKVT